MGIFDIALEKRFDDSTDITLVNVTGDDSLLIRDTSTGQIMRLPFSTLTAAISNALSSSFASLVDGKIPASQLPSYVDDVLEYANVGAFPATGESGKIYISNFNNLTYRWSGTGYVEISPSPGSTDAVPEGPTNKYFTNARALSAAPAETPTTIGAIINASSAKITPVDADTFSYSDSAASGILKRFTWANLKAAFKTYFDTLYSPVTGPGTAQPFTVGSLIFGKAVGLGNAADMNTLTVGGFYDGYNFTNGPAGLTMNLYLEVVKFSGSNGYCKQVVTQAEGTGTTPGDIYARIQFAGSWTTWKKITQV